MLGVGDVDQNDRCWNTLIWAFSSDELERSQNFKIQDRNVSGMLNVFGVKVRNGLFFAWTNNYNARIVFHLITSFNFLKTIFDFHKIVHTCVNEHKLNLIKEWIITQTLKLCQRKKPEKLIMCVHVSKLKLSSRPMAWYSD